MNFPMITEKGQLCIVPFDLQNWFSIIILDVKLDNPSFIPGLICDNIKVPLILFLTVNWINPFLSSVITWIEFSLPKGFEFRLCVHLRDELFPVYQNDPTKHRCLRAQVQVRPHERALHSKAFHRRRPQRDLRIERGMTWTVMMLTYFSQNLWDICVDVAQT